MSQPDLAAMRAVANRLDSIGLDHAWFKEALASATEHMFEGTRLKLISPVAFLATKHVAFMDRGAGDYYASHDLEDLITVIDGRENMVAEIAAAPADLRAYVSASIRGLLAEPTFDEALPGFLPADRASQQRLPGLRQKLQAIVKFTQ